MGARFVALTVGQGDAFYLQRDGWSVLVDGGRSPTALPGLFQRCTGAKGVDVLVCTHNDADHANGVIGYLESDLGCGEVWLPGRWAAALPHVLEPFHEVLETIAWEVLDQLPHIEGEGAEGTPLERLAPPVPLPPAENDGAEVGQDGWPEPLWGALERAADDESGSHCLTCGWLPYWPYFRERHRDGLLASAISAAKRIRRIAIAAFRRGIPVRWFEHQPGNPGGGCAHLQPLNARRLARLHPDPRALLHLLHLTVANRESLVFWSPGDLNAPGVLFTADSDLARVCIPSAPGAIVTAPHHGSESNAPAYAAVAGVGASSVLWVRSDGRFGSRPCSAYLAQSTRLCTICRRPVTTKAAVRLFARTGRWTRHPATRRCQCA
jgi:hypothetical protein